MSLASAILPAGAMGADLAAAKQLYHDGQFLEAANAARSLGGKQGYILYMRSVVAHGRYNAPEAEREAIFGQAWTIAREAMEMYPDDPEILIQTAAVLGRYGSAIGTRRALERDYINRVGAILERAVALDPDNAEAIGALGTWHARLIGEGGFLAAMLSSAKRDEGITLLSRAEGLVGDNLPLLYTMARGWRALEMEERALKLLERALALPKSDAYSNLVRERAERLAARLGGS